jgi:hypothetical protein
MLMAHFVSSNCVNLALARQNNSELPSLLAHINSILRDAFEEATWRIQTLQDSLFTTNMKNLVSRQGTLQAQEAY